MHNVLYPRAIQLTAVKLRLLATKTRAQDPHTLACLRLGTYLRIRVLNPSALHSVYYTEAKASFGKVYALLLDWPNDGKLELTLPDVTATPAVRLLGSSAEIKVAPRSGNVGITIVLPLNVEMEVLLQPAWAFELTGVQ